ncbi:10840_t:CDS:2, partial [Dentiscutata erythropus]
KLRGNIVLCLYHFHKTFLEASFYALSMIYLQISKTTLQELLDAKKIFDEVRDGNFDDISSGLGTCFDSKSLVKIGDGEIIYHNSEIQDVICDGMVKISAQLLHKVNRRLECYWGQWGIRTLSSATLYNNVRDSFPPFIAFKAVSFGSRYAINLAATKYLGWVLISKKIVHGKSEKELVYLVKNIFNSTLNKKDELEKIAKELDKNFHELRKKNVEIHLENGERNNDSNEYEDDAREMPFEARLEEILNITRINLIILDLLHSSRETLEDILWVIGREEEFSEEFPEEFPEEFSESIQELCEYSKTAANCEQLAEKEVNRLNSLNHWQEALNNYEHALKINPNRQDLQLNCAKCLLKLSNIAYCKQANYKKAANKALRLDSKNKLAGNQKDLLKSLIVQDNIDRSIDRYEKEKSDIKYEIDFLNNSHNNESPVYNILSIDGGGIRGILPALWLSEIESRIHRPISHLFNMIAGTSTGGIIAAGLSASWFSQSNTSYEYSDSRPRFLASEILNIYKNEAKELFTTNSSFFKYIITKREVYKRWLLFGKMKLDKALTELVIPAVNEINITQLHIFTSYDGRENASKNDSFVDVLMSTTAASTFSPPYEIMNKGFFLDGGLTLNNPALEAYNQAKRYNVSEENIHVLFLGTGSYIPAFLGTNVHNVMMSPKEDESEKIPYLLELGYQYIEELDCSDDNPINKLVESLENKNNN